MSFLLFLWFAYVGTVPFHQDFVLCACLQVSFHLKASEIRKRTVLWGLGEKNPGLPD